MGTGKCEKVKTGRVARGGGGEAEHKDDLGAEGAGEEDEGWSEPEDVISLGEEQQQGHTTQNEYVFFMRWRTRRITLAVIYARTTGRQRQPHLCA